MDTEIHQGWRTWWVSCSCGWRSERFRDRADAVEAEDQHLSEHEAA